MLVVQEDFLQFLWRYQKFEAAKLQTVVGEKITVLLPGVQNFGKGPDFLNAKVQINDILWMGHVEIHSNASAWYHHQHHTDTAYDNVILHVVWKNDMDVCLPSGGSVFTLCLADIVDPRHIQTYWSVFLKPARFIPCERSVKDFPNEGWVSWKELLFIERVESKVEHIRDYLQKSKNDWEAVLFWVLSKGVGLNQNGAAFLDMAQRTPFKIVRQQQSDALQLEALFMGQAGMLVAAKDDYQQDLSNRYTYLKNKYRLKSTPTYQATFSRLRPPNFPTIRLAQLAQLYSTQGALFQIVVEQNPLERIFGHFQQTVSPYWKTHYNFGVRSASSSKKISRSFFDLLVINVLIPIRFAYAKYLDYDATPNIFEWAASITFEKNSVTKKFKELGVPVINALDSQSLIQLKKQYCDVKKCLRCALGYYFMKLR